MQANPLPLETPVEDVVLVKPREAFVKQDGDPAAAAAGKEVILLHGWNSNDAAMRPWRDAIRALPSGRDARIWSATYDTHLKSFRQSAAELKRLFESKGVDFTRSLVLGYSMGGVVARQMVADGFRAQAVVTTCSPHEGLAPWVPTPEPGTMSLAPWSSDLKALNADPRDRAARARYHLHGVVYRDARGEHADDTTVIIESGLGASLGAVGDRQRVRLNYGNGFPPLADPHMSGMDPQRMRPTVRTLDALLSKL